MKTAILLLAVCSSVPAQTDTMDVIPHSALPPLALVLESAVRTHPAIERNRASVQRSEAELSSMKKRWLDGLTMDAGMQWGAYGDRTVDKLLLGSRVGFTLRVSLWDLLSQANTNDQYTAVVEEAKRSVEVTQQSILREVISVYNEAALAERLYAIAVREHISARINAQTARQQFTEGEILMSELSRITVIESNAEEKVETYKSRWDTAVKVLEIVAGRRLEDLR